MTRAEILAKLEKIASDGGTIAELNACKALLTLPEYAEDGSSEQADPFKDLDADHDLARARRHRSQAA